MVKQDKSIGVGDDGHPVKWKKGWLGGVREGEIDRRGTDQLRRDMGLVAQKGWLGGTIRNDDGTPMINERATQQAARRRGRVVNNAGAPTHGPLPRPTGGGWGRGQITGSHPDVTAGVDATRDAGQAGVRRGLRSRIADWNQEAAKYAHDPEHRMRAVDPTRYAQQLVDLGHVDAVLDAGMNIHVGRGGKMIVEGPGHHEAEMSWEPKASVPQSLLPQRSYENAYRPVDRSGLGDGGLGV